MDILTEFIEQIKIEKRFGENIIAHRIFPAVAGKMSSLPENLNKDLQEFIVNLGMKKIYSHQAKAYKHVMSGDNVLISTGVASGKSLCYQMPIMQHLQKNPNMRALLLFPTKALTQDQIEKFNSFFNNDLYPGNACRTGIYDGDTSQNSRREIREQANLVFTNPDMLHLGILPHHTKWAVFFKNLEFIIIDEVHIYRGIFGSNFANVIRRLKRIAKFYGSEPQFIMTSATLSNSDEFIGRLIEDTFVQISEDGSPKGERHLMIYNPPLVNRDLGIRRRAMLETVELGKQALGEHFQSLIFAHSRRLVEMILKFMHQHNRFTEEIKAYRSGYLASERRKIEAEFRDGDVRMAIATNALELGIDVGELDIVIINGYPGSIASTLQQAGRAGRKGRSSLAILVATANLIDQFLVQNPDYLFENTPEEALIDPDNAFILMHHLKCAVFEKPFKTGESYGFLKQEILDQYLSILQKYGLLHKSGETYYWRANSYPADNVSLRSVGAKEYLLKDEDVVIGTVDEQSAFWLTHPNAVYLHNGESFLVSDLNMETMEITLQKQNTDYYTQSQSRTNVSLLELKAEAKVPGGIKKRGDIQVTDQVVGYKRLKWSNNEILDYGNLDLPPSEMITKGFWIIPDKTVIDKLMEQGLWNSNRNDYGSQWERIKRETRARDNHECQNCGRKEGDSAFSVHHKIPFKSFSSAKEANKSENLITLCPSCHNLAEKQLYIQSSLAGLAWLLSNIAPFFIMCDRSDIRVHSENKSSLAEGEPALIIYDAIPGGLGLSDSLYEQGDTLLKKALSIILSCSCKTGCPACVGPVAENGTGAKKEVEVLLKGMLNK